MTATVLRADARQIPLPDASVDLIVTSPPYFALRSYTDTPELCDRCRELVGEGWAYPRAGDTGRNLREAWPDWEAHVAAEHKPTHYAGQIGAEPTPAEYIASLIDCTREWVRVLKPSGSLFVNLGDKYANKYGGPSGKSSEIAQQGKNAVAAGRIDLRGGLVREKSLMMLPERYRIAAVDELGLIARAVLVWSKPNGLPESVTDRVRRSHEDWVHLTKQPRYFSAVDEIRETYAPGTAARYAKGYNPNDYQTGKVRKGIGVDYSGAFDTNPLGKLPGSVWEIPTEPLKVPDHLGVDHFAAFPTEWPRRIVQGWSPSGICTACGEGRRPVAEVNKTHAPRPGRLTALTNAHGQDGREGARPSSVATITGEACACPDASAPTRPAVVLDPFGGTGTTALVASVLGRHGISVDMSADYCRLARWRTTDPGQRAKAARVTAPPKQLEGQQDLFAEIGAVA